MCWISRKDQWNYRVLLEEVGKSGLEEGNQYSKGYFYELCFPIPHVSDIICIALTCLNTFLQGLSCYYYKMKDFLTIIDEYIPLCMWEVIRCFVLIHLYTGT